MIAIDGLTVSEYIHPVLATLCQPMEEMGRCSVEILLDLVEGAGRSVTRRCRQRCARARPCADSDFRCFSRPTGRENKF